MANQTQSFLATISTPSQDITVSPADRQILRQLAPRVAELAARPIEGEKRRLWYLHNDLYPTRPLIFCDPENGWNEIITDQQLQCTGKIARGWEMRLRKEIFWGRNMGDDRVVESTFDIPHVYDQSDWGMHETKVGGDSGGSYRWEAPLVSYDLLPRLHFPVITVHYPATDRLLNLAHDTLGDFLNVRLRTRWWWTLGMTWTAVLLRGLEQLMLDMCDYPKELHRLMAFLRDGHIAMLDFLESHKLLAANNDGTYVGSGGFGYTRQLPVAPSIVRPADMWGFCESQETVGVGPDMFQEFIWPYQLPILHRFGLACYGCCEPLDTRWHVIKNLPNLRRVSVSAWANVEKMAENLGSRYIYSWKPTPADLALPEMDEPRIRQSIRRTLDATRSCHLEMIMKDNHTLGGGPRNAVRWCQIAREEIDKG